MVGVLMLLLMAGLALVQMAGVSAGSARAVCAEARARLAAASGADYAGARLIEDSRPRWIESADRRGEDWTLREAVGTGASAARNPSYSHGEPWIDVSQPPNGKDDDGDGLVDEAGEGAGIWNPGESFVDHDGDGRFSAWSGRLRGAGGAFEERFSLAVGGRGGWIPVNAGFVRHSTNTALVRDWKNVAYHRGLSHLLNNLGAILLPPTGTGRISPPSGINGKGHTFELSRLGFDLIEGRPFGGYRSFQEIRETLLDRKYLPREIDRILPYLDLGPYDALADGARCGYVDSGEFPAYVPINLLTAPREVLESLWRYLGMAPQNGHLLADTTGFTPQGKAIPAWKVARSSRTGSVTDLTALTFFECAHFTGWGSENPVSLFGHIYPDEAASLAETLILARKGTALDWPGLHVRLAAEAPRLFRQDALDLAGDANSDGVPDDPPRYPLALRSWLQAKADLAFQAVAIDPRAEPAPSDMPWYRVQPMPFNLTSWSSWGADRDPKKDGVQPSSTVGFAQVHCLAHPQNGATWQSPKFPFNAYAALVGFYEGVFSPQGGTLAAPTRFWVASEARGGSAWAGGAFETAERLEITSQEDFEALSGGAFSALAGRGISLFDPDPAGRFDVRDEPHLDAAAGGMVAPVRRSPHVVSLPRRDRRSLMPGDLGLAPILHGFSRTFGALTVAPRDGGLQGAKLYWPLSQADDGNPANDYACKMDPSYAPQFGPPPALEAGNYDVPDPAFANSPLTAVKNAKTLQSMAAQPNPFLVTGYTTAFDLPATKANGVYLGEFSIECWLGRESEIQVFSWMPAGAGGPTAPDALDAAIPKGAITKQLGRIVLTTCPFKSMAPDATLQTIDRDGTLFLLQVDWSGVGSNVNGADKLWFAGPNAWLDLADEPGLEGKDRWYIENARRDPASPASWAQWQGSEPAWLYHVVLTFERKPIPSGAVTIVRMHVNGSRYDTAGSMMSAQLGSIDLDLSMPGTQVGRGDLYSGEKEWLLVRNAGPVRLYDRRLSDADVAARYAQERFVRTGLFRSPTYVLDEPGRFIQAQATAIVPPGLCEADLGTDPYADATSPNPARCRPALDGGSPQKAIPLARGPVQLLLAGYETAPGDPGHPKLAAGFPAPIDPASGVVSLSSLNLGEVRSFDYLVAFDLTKAAGVIRDPPVFESVWLSLRRKSRSGIWSRWGLH